jgi:hypothetical protein
LFLDRVKCQEPPTVSGLKEKIKIMESLRQ